MLGHAGALGELLVEGQDVLDVVTGYPQLLAYFLLGCGNYGSDCITGDLAYERVLERGVRLLQKLQLHGLLVNAEQFLSRPLANLAQVVVIAVVELALESINWHCLLAAALVALGLTVTVDHEFGLAAGALQALG